MAASSYYQLNPLPSSGSDADSNIYSGSGYNRLPPEPLQHPAHTANTYNNPPPLHRSDSSSTPQPLKPANTPNNRLRQRRFQKWKRYLRILKVLSKIFTVLFSAIMFGIMIFMTVKFYTTKDIIRDGRNAWPKDPKPWPTFLLLAGSGFTLFLSLFTLLSYCIDSSAARRSWKLTVVKYAIHILSWIIISFLYRYEKNLHGKPNDLWGWSCADKANAIQPEFHGVVDFKALCSIQTKSWIVSIMEVVVKISFAIGHFVIYRKTREDEKQHLADGLGDAVTDLVEDF